MDSVELVFYTVSLARAVDCHPRIPIRCDQFKRICHELEFVLEDPAVWDSDPNHDLDDWDDMPDRDLILAQLDVAGGGWHRT